MKGRLLETDHEIQTHGVYTGLGRLRRTGIVMHDPATLSAIAEASRDPAKAKKLYSAGYGSDAEWTEMGLYGNVFNYSVTITLKTEAIKAACDSLMRDIPVFLREAESAGVEFDADLPMLTPLQVRRLTPGFREWRIGPTLQDLMHWVVSFSYPNNRKRTITIIHDFPDSEFVVFPVGHVGPTLEMLVGDLETLSTLLGRGARGNGNE